MIVSMRFDRNTMKRTEYEKVCKAIGEDIELDKEEDMAAWISSEDKAKYEADGTDIETVKAKIRETAFARLAENDEVQLKNPWKEYVVDIHAFLTECPTAEIRINKVVSTLGGISPSDSKAMETFDRLASLTQLYIEATDLFNEKANVMRSGNELMNLRRVKAMIDLCTEDLQQQLDDGWQIVAVCVQSNQRRPDYILGMDSGINTL